MKTRTLRTALLPLFGVLAGSCNGGIVLPAADQVTTTQSALAFPTCQGDANLNFDDASVINGFTNSATEVVLPAGVCNIKSVINLGTGVWLRGQGASTVLRAKANIAGMIYSGATNAKVSDLTLDGTGFTTPGVVLLGGQNATLTRLTVRNFTGQGIVLQATGGTNFGFTISENILQSVGRGIGLSGTPNTVTLSKVIITDNAIQTTTGEAVYLRGVRDVVVSGNILDTGTNAGVIVESGVSASIIANNLLRAGSGNATAGIALGGGALDINTDIVINGNQVTGYGIGLSLANTTNQSFSRVSIASNTFTGITGSALRLADGTDVLVSKNQLNGAYGIEIPSGVRGLTRLSIQGNHIGGTTAGVRFASANLTDVLLDSNTFSATTAVQTATAPLGRFVAASNLGWKGASSGLHAGRNTSGTCTIGVAAPLSMVCNFPTGSVPEPNLEYRVVLTPTTSNVTNLAKQRITTVTKATTGFTLATETALTGNDSVTYDWVLLRDPA